MEELKTSSWFAKSAYECFIKNADPDTSDANPVAAIQRIFDQRASDDLKAQVKTEGKTAAGAYQFLWAVARLCKQTDGGCHISPETGYAIAMHYFQDVPVSVLDEFEPALVKAREEREAAERKERAAKAAAEMKAKAKTAQANAKKRRLAKEKANSDQKDTAQPSVDGRSVASVGNASTTPQDTPAAPTTNEPPAAKESPYKPSKPTPQTSAQMSLFDDLFA